MGRGKGRKAAAVRAASGSSSTQSLNSSAKATLKAAEQSQQRGERRGGQEAIPHFQDAVHKYRQCMTESPDAETLANAQVLCSETIQLWAKAILAAEAHLPDSEQSIDVERSAQRQARELYQEAVQVGKQCQNAATGEWARPDAAVNCGNCLSEAAELLSAEEQVDPLVGSVACYEAALSLEPDAVTWSNLADALIQLAQALSATQRLQEAEEAVARACASYQQSTALSSSEDGDDLPGLLCNWGTGLTAVGGMLRDAGASSNAAEVLKEAVMRVNCSLDFQPTDIQVHIALAEAQSGLADALAANSGAAAQNSSSGMFSADAPAASAAAVAPNSSFGALSGTVASPAAATWQEAAAAALTACDAAVNIDRNHVGAHVVKAEVHAVHAKLCKLLHCSSHRSAQPSGAGSVQGGVDCSGGCEKCAVHWQHARRCYEKVLEAPQKLGSCSERCTVRYNYACALAMTGARQEALGLLQWVAGKHPEDLAGADVDAELRSLWDLNEFRALLQPGANRG